MAATYAAHPSLTAAALASCQAGPTPALAIRSPVMDAVTVALSSTAPVLLVGERSIRLREPDPAALR